MQRGDNQGGRLLAWISVRPRLPDGDCILSLMATFGQRYYKVLRAVAMGGCVYCSCRAVPLPRRMAYLGQRWRQPRRPVHEIFRDCTDAAASPLPSDLLADHYSTTVMLVWQRCCLDRTCAREEAPGYLEALLGGP